MTRSVHSGLYRDIYTDTYTDTLPLYFWTLWRYTNAVITIIIIIVI